METEDGLKRTFVQDNSKYLIKPHSEKILKIKNAKKKEDLESNNHKPNLESKEEK